ncbi:single-stranded-DNA-specific exonuclease RecJ [[Eubacterium] hominis]|uniref:single-stranded-DNA-specific exonuclease RecJ n=1 Tax=[Eubacterium] hominis TaxID=2764325 RepID=UPI003A4E1FEE
MNITLQDVSNTEEIQKTLSLSHLCAKVLAAKNLTYPQISEILSAPVLQDPMNAYHMKEVVMRIQQAKKNNEKILVCGDYDADGICATTILFDALQRYGVTCGFYIPDRFKQGYGLHPDTVKMADEKGYTLLITVDNGVKAFDALKEAKQRGLDVIVTDHHDMEESDIDAWIVLHPFTMGEEFQYLSGAGVALEISRALLHDVKEHIILACIASIADVMPLKKETRDIVRLGIFYLKQGLCKPIQALANDRYPKWDETMIAFQIVPKLNVMGRLADMVNVNNMVRFLLLKRADEIQRVATQIHDLNNHRKKMSNEMVETAKSLVHPEYNFQMLYHESFHEGIVGLVAGKIAEELHQPVMVLSRHDEILKGSIRSQGYLDLTTFFDGCMDVLDSYGGHKAAAGIGFSLSHKQNVQDYMNEHAKEYVTKAEAEYDVIDTLLSELSIQEVESLQALAPFGEGFDEPLFYLQNVEVKQIKTMGNGAHVKWVLSDEVEAVLFHDIQAYETFADRKTMNFIATIGINRFMGRKKVNLFVREAF